MYGPKMLLGHFSTRSVKKNRPSGVGVLLVPALIATVEDRFSLSLNGQHCQNRSGTNAA